MMKLVLAGLKNLQISNEQTLRPKAGFKTLKMRYCAVCRTDAKMWNEGHRDLVLPRVPGHELVAEDEKGARFTIWPAVTCETCAFCMSGRENLCEDIRIMGFHYDGGFADHIVAPDQSVIPVPQAIPSAIACFAEPTGCVFNALDKLDLAENQRIIIYGGGVLGLIAALACRARGAQPLVIEKNEEKIAKIAPFLQQTDIQCCKATTDSTFNAALIACADPVAFSLGVGKLGKGGRLSYFSGLTKNQRVDTNLLNLIHYKESEVFGAYGLTRQNMADALGFICNHTAAYKRLIEKIIPPEHLHACLPDVLSGKSLKYILDFTQSNTKRADTKTHTQQLGSEQPSADHGHRQLKEWTSLANFNDRSRTVIKSIVPVANDLKPAAQRKIDNKTKPLGALGRIEELALQMSMIQNSLDPCIDRKALFVFAGDHGIAEEGVSAFPSEVTSQMVHNFLEGGAAINVFCRHHDIDMRVVDMGVNADFTDHPALVKKKVRKGTRNFALEPAMTPQEAKTAIDHGMDVFFTEHEKKRIDIVGLGEMGIANTTASSAIISSVTGITPAQATGRGTGVDDKGLEHKAQVIERAIRFQNPKPRDGFDVLQKIGGFEIAGIAGAVLAAASVRAAVVLDGVISTAAGLIAYLINPDIRPLLISGHRSVETAQIAALSFMNIEPIMDLNMRLGEGTGAAFAIDIVDAACRMMREMASFDDAGVSKDNN